MIAAVLSRIAPPKIVRNPIKLKVPNIGKSTHSAQQSGSWNWRCAPQNGGPIAKKDRLRKFDDQKILGYLENVSAMELRLQSWILQR